LRIKRLNYERHSGVLGLLESGRPFLIKKTNLEMIL
jgi:hypothetical protein